MNDETEKLLVFIVDKARKSKVSTIAFNVSEVKAVYDIRSDLNELLDELELGGMLSNYIIASGGNVEAYLTPMAMRYFIGNKKPQPNSNKTRPDSGEKTSPDTRPDSGSKPGINAELVYIEKKIEKKLSALDSLDADILADILELIREELSRQTPRGCRLMNCLTLLSSAMSSAEEIPALKKDLETLGNLIAKYIK